MTRLAVAALLGSATLMCGCRKPPATVLTDTAVWESSNQKWYTLARCRTVKETVSQITFACDSDDRWKGQTVTYTIPKFLALKDKP